MDLSPGAERVHGPPGQFPGPRFLVATVAVFFLLAIGKPWSFVGGGSAPGRPDIASHAPASTNVPTVATASPAAPAVRKTNAMACLSGETEQLVTIERWPGHEVRSWDAMSGQSALGPLDSRLHPVAIFSSHVVGLGICARLVGGTEPAPAARLLDVQAITGTIGGGRTAIDLGIPDPMIEQDEDAGSARLYGPPATVTPGGAPPEHVTSAPSRTPDWSAWPTGSYALAYAYSTDGPQVRRWLRLDLTEGAGQGH